MSRWRWAGLGVAGAVVLALPWVLPGTLLGVRGSGPGAPEELSPALRSLRAPEYDPRFGLEYWMGRYERDGHGGELGRALRYCRDRDLGDRPNCRTVRVLDAASRVPLFLDQLEEGVGR